MTLDELFTQSPPRLGNQFQDDAFLRAYLRRVLPSDVLRDVEPQLEALGDLAGGDLYALSLEDRLNEPRLVQWDAWGNRVDRIQLTPMWDRVAPLAAEHGLIAIPYEARHGRYSRIHQFAAVYLFHPSSDFYTCPLAMTDGAARTLLTAGNAALIERAVPRLTSRDPARAWTSGQWMTETTGGSDVGTTTTRAAQTPEGEWLLYGKKWFTSAITSQMALTLARPQGNGPGGRNLALFYLETRAATALAFELVRLMGLEEAGEIDDGQRALLRLLTPVTKLITAKQAVAVVSEAIEAFGGAGYIEDTGLPAILRDAQVLPIWEGTTNVLALDALLRADVATGVAAARRRIHEAVGDAPAELGDAARAATAALEHAIVWLEATREPEALQAGARRFAFTAGRALEAALLIEHAGWAAREADGSAAIAAARRFAAAPIDFISDRSDDGARVLIG